MHVFSEVIVHLYLPHTHSHKWHHLRGRTVWFEGKGLRCRNESLAADSPPLVQIALCGFAKTNALGKIMVSIVDILHIFMCMTVSLI